MLRYFFLISLYLFNFEMLYILLFYSISESFSNEIKLESLPFFLFMDTSDFMFLSSSFSSEDSSLNSIWPSSSSSSSDFPPSFCSITPSLPSSSPFPYSSSDVSSYFNSITPSSEVSYSSKSSSEVSS